MLSIENDRIFSPYILVIDDDKLLNELFCGYFKGEGFATGSAYSLKGGIKFLKEN